MFVWSFLADWLAVIRLRRGPLLALVIFVGLFLFLLSLAGVASQGRETEPPQVVSTQ